MWCNAQIWLLLFSAVKWIMTQFADCQSTFSARIKEKWTWYDYTSERLRDIEGYFNVNTEEYLQQGLIWKMHQVYLWTENGWQNVSLNQSLKVSCFLQIVSILNESYNISQALWSTSLCLLSHAWSVCPDINDFVRASFQTAHLYDFDLCWFYICFCKPLTKVTANPLILHGKHSKGLSHFFFGFDSESYSEFQNQQSRFFLCLSSNFFKENFQKIIASLFSLVKPLPAMIV